MSERRSKTSKSFIEGRKGLKDLIELLTGPSKKEEEEEKKKKEVDLGLNRRKVRKFKDSLK